MLVKIKRRVDDNGLSWLYWEEQLVIERPAGTALEIIPRGAKTDCVASVVDLFCGAGGLSRGFFDEGIQVNCGIDIDEACRYPFETNNEAVFVRRDISSITGPELKQAFSPSSYSVLVGCAPCQPFSKYTQGREGKGIEDPKWTLLREFARLIEETSPDVVSMENVQRLRHFRNGEVLQVFIRKLAKAGYWVSERDVFCPDYGVPQSRTRLVLLASKLGPITLDEPNHLDDCSRTVREAIGDLAEIAAGEYDPDDPLHASAGLSPVNLKRIRRSKPGGTWRDWPEALRASCHTKETGRGYASVYGRMLWDEPAPTITTQFHGFGNGRFGHPEQNRAISLREGAILQTFPADYAFVPPGTDPNFKVMGRLIGNAVPVQLGRVIARSILAHIREHENLPSGKSTRSKG